MPGLPRCRCGRSRWQEPCGSAHLPRQQFESRRVTSWGSTGPPLRHPWRIPIVDFRCFPIETPRLHLIGQVFEINKTNQKSNLPFIAAAWEEPAEILTIRISLNALIRLGPGGAFLGSGWPSWPLSDLPKLNTCPIKRHKNLSLNVKQYSYHFWSKQVSSHPQQLRWGLSDPSLPSPSWAPLDRLCSSHVPIAI